MQGDRMTQFAAVLGALILVIGTAGLVYGSDADDTSDIEVTVDAVDPEIDIWELNINHDEIDPTLLIDDGVDTEDYGIELGAAEFVEISGELRVNSPSGFDYVEEAWISIDPDLDDPNDATASDDDPDGFYYEHWDADYFEDVDGVEENDDYDDYVHYLEFEWEANEPGEEPFDPFLRFGDWHIEAEVNHEEEDAPPTDDDEALEAFFVETYATLTTEDSIEGSAAPGETIEDEDWDPKDSFTYSINAAHYWEYEVDEFEHTETDHTIDADEFEAEFTPDGDPVYEEEVESDDLEYSMDIPIGQYPGLYESEITHQIFNEDAND